MVKIFKLPKQEEPVKNKIQEATPKAKAVNGSVVITGIWGVTVLLWPILKWIISLDCVFQFMRMMYYWDTPGTYAGFKFIFHFGVLSALTYFVSVYRPKGI